MLRHIDLEYFLVALGWLDLTHFKVYALPPRPQLFTICHDTALQGEVICIGVNTVLDLAIGTLGNLLEVNEIETGITFENRSKNLSFRDLAGF